MKLRAISKLILMIVGLLCVFLFTACSDIERLSIDVPEGFARNTLKEFARQAQVEIIFDSVSIHEVKTNAVKGQYDPQTALHLMLEGTPLSFVFDDESGAYAIVRSESSKSGHVFIHATSIQPFLFCYIHINNQLIFIKINLS